MSTNSRRTVEDWIAVLAMMALCVITMGNVVVRYLTDTSFAWTEEFSVFLLVLTTMAGASSAALRNSHIRIEYFLISGSSRRRRLLGILGTVLTAAFFIVLAFLSGLMAWDDFRYEEVSMGLEIPRWYYTTWVPALSVVIAIRAVQALRSGVREQ
ncbi:MAG: TRAP transporter small permease [Burkholderiaceae bacterium]